MIRNGTYTPIFMAILCGLLLFSGQTPAHTADGRITMEFEAIVELNGEACQPIIIELVTFPNGTFEGESEFAQEMKENTNCRHVNGSLEVNGKRGAATNVASGDVKGNLNVSVQSGDETYSIDGNFDETFSLSPGQSTTLAAEAGQLQSGVGYRYRIIARAIVARPR